MEGLILKLAFGEKIADEDIEDGLYEICENTHSSCDGGCPVYVLNDYEAPNTQPFEVNRGCDCFKDGKKMLEFIRKNK